MQFCFTDSLIRIFVQIGVTHYLKCQMHIVVHEYVRNVELFCFSNLFSECSSFCSLWILSFLFAFTRLPALVKRQKIDRPFYVLAIKSSTVIIDRPIHSANSFTSDIDTSDIHAATNM